MRKRDKDRKIDRDREGARERDTDVARLIECG